MTRPIHTEKVKRDKSKSHGEQAHEIAEKIESDHGISVFGEDQTHYVNTTIGDDGQVHVTVHEAVS